MGNESPFAFVGSLHKMAIKVRDAAHMEWLFCSVVDSVKMGYLDKSAFCVRNLQPQTGNKKGILDLLLFKKDVRDYLVNSWMPRKFPAASGELQKTIRDISAGHAIYREKVLPYPVVEDDDAAAGTQLSPKQVDLTWKKGWPRSAERLLQLVEGIAFSSEFNPSLNNGVKNRKSPEEMLDYAQIKENIKEIDDALAQEAAALNPPGTAAGAAAVAAAGAVGASSSSGGGGTPAALSNDSKEADDKEIFDTHWRNYAARKVDSHVTLISEPQTETQLTHALKNVGIIKTSKGVRGVDYVAAIFPAGLGSESITNPHKYGAPFKKERLMKCGKAFLKSRQEAHGPSANSSCLDLGPNDMFIALDNQKPGNLTKFTDFLKDNANKKSHLKVKRFEVVYDFASLKARNFRTKGAGTVSQVEHMSIVTSGDVLNVPVRDHKPYGGCNLGSSITNVTLPPYSKIWSMKYEDKKLFFGKMRLPIGGTGNDDDDDGEDDQQDGEEVPPTVDETEDSGKQVSTRGD